MLKFPIPFGARIIKTGLAVGISVYLADFFNLEPIIFAAISTMLNIQPSIYQSFENAVKQIMSHVLSVFIALSFGYLIGSGPVEMAIVTMLVISLNKKFNMQNYIVMGVVAAVFVLDALQNEFLSHAITRSYAIFLGLAVALSVNLFIAPPRYKDRLVESLKELNSKTVNLFQSSVERFINLKALDDKELKEEYSKIDELFKNSNNFLTLYKKQFSRDSEKEREFYVYKKYIDFNMAIFHSIRDINIATEQRIALRNKWGNPPISPTFKDILAMLESSLTTFNTLNKLLYKAVFEENTDKPVYIDNIFWEKLSVYIDKWHNNLTGADFIHAFMYVAMVANNIKIVCRDAKSFLSELTTEENDKSDKLLSDY